MCVACVTYACNHGWAIREAFLCAWCGYLLVCSSSAVVLAMQNGKGSATRWTESQKEHVIYFLKHVGSSPLFKITRTYTDIAGFPVHGSSVNVAGVTTVTGESILGGDGGTASDDVVKIVASTIKKKTFRIVSGQGSSCASRDHLTHAARNTQ
jgi:hypothetical protein